MRIYNSTITGSLKIKGDIEAENYIVNTTVTALTQSFSSGSTIFGDSVDDTHQFTGSLEVTGSIFIDDIGGGRSLSIGDSSRGNHKIYDHQYYLRTDSSLWLSSAYIFATSDFNIDPGANDIRLGSSSGGPNTIHFRTDGLTDGITITQNHLSGSIASTGSFGRLQVNGSQGSGVAIGPLNTGNADDRKLTIVGYDEPMIEFETHGGWGRQRIQGNFGGTLKMWNSGSQAKTLSMQVGHNQERQGHVRFMHSEYDTISIGLNGSYPIVYFGAESGSNNYTGNAVISSRSSTSAVNHLYFTKNNVLSGSSSSTGSFGMASVGRLDIRTDLSAAGWKITGDEIRASNGLITINNQGSTGVYINNGVFLGGNYNVVQLTVRANSSQTANIQEWTDSSNNVLASISPTGDISGSATSTGSFGMITTPSDISGKPAASLHKFAFLRASDPLDNSTSAFGGKSGNTIFGHDAGSQIVQNNGAGHSNTFIGDHAGHGNATGTHNTLVGHVAGLGGSGDDNVAIGSYSGYNFVTGDANILVGQSSGFNMRSGSNNVGIGDNALYASHGTAQSTVIGAFAGYSVTTGTGVVGLGYKAGYANKTQGNWIAIGYEAMGGTPGTNEAAGEAIGYRSMFAAMDGASGTALGNSTLENLVGDYTVGIGGEAGRYASGSFNTFVGFSAGKGGTTSAPFSSGQYNTAVGYLAHDAFTTGKQNVAIGWEAATSLETGYYSTFLGVRAGRSVTTGNVNTFIGWQSGYAVTDTSNKIAIGYRAGYANGGEMDVHIGYEAGLNVTAGDNISIGRSAGRGYHGVGQTEFQANTTNRYNISIGTFAGTKAIGTNNVNVGHNAGYHATGSYNTFVGSEAGKGYGSAPFSSGEKNTVVGYQAFDTFTTAYENCIFGYQAGTSITTGRSNNLFGAGAGDTLTTGQYNVAVGRSTLQTATNVGTSIAIGDQAMSYVNPPSGEVLNGVIAIGAGTLGDATGLEIAAVSSIAIGGSAGSNAKNLASEFVIIGNSAGQKLNGVSSTYVGWEAGQYASGSYNTFFGAEAGRGATTSAPFSSGKNNTAVGKSAFDAFTTGFSNAAFGVSALGQVTTGAYNIGIGNSAGGAILTAQANVAIGADALAANQATNDMIAIGFQAMFSSNHADTAGNVAVGYTALRMNVKGAQNVAIGDEAGRYATGSKNTFVGHRAGLGSTGAPYASGNENTAIGNDAFRLAETAQRNVAIGHRAGESIKTGNNNTYIGGYRTGYYNHAGTSNIGIGNSAIGADANTYVNELVAVGVAAGALTAGNVGTTDGNVYVGYNAGYSNISGSGLTFLGFKAGQNATGSNNTFLGYRAGQGYSGAAATTGGDNTAIGYQSMRVFTSGVENIFMGSNAGNAITTGNGNVGIGHEVLKVHATGQYNVAIGWKAMDDTDAGGNAANSNNNIAIGAHALGGTWANAISEFNVAIGQNSMAGALNAAINNVAVGIESLKAVTTSDNNTAIGYQAGKSILTGPRNTLVGYQAGDTITVGENNVIIGASSDANATATSDTIVIGYNATPTDNNQTILGTSDQKFTLIGGGKAICRVTDHNMSTSGKTITLSLGAHQGWISGVMHIVATDSGNNGGGVYQVSFSAFMDAGVTTTDITQTIIHSDRGPGSSNYIELNSPTAPTNAGSIQWVLDNDHSGAFNSFTVTVEAYMASNPVRYLSLATS